jgi:hypothetical protein
VKRQAPPWRWSPMRSCSGRVGFGVTHRTTQRPIGADTVIESASISKTVFAYLVLKASVRRQSAFIVVTNGDRRFEDVIRPVLRSGPRREFLPVSI